MYTCMYILKSYLKNKQRIFNFILDFIKNGYCVEVMKSVRV